MARTPAPRKTITLPDAERDQLVAFAADVAERQGEERQADTLGRSWLVRVDRTPIAGLRIEVTGQPLKGPLFVQHVTIPMATFGAVEARTQAIVDVIDALDAAAADALAVPE